MAPINDRMPVIVAPKNYERWLDTDSKSTPSRDLLQPYPAEEMEAWTLSSYVESGIELPYMSTPPISAFSATAPHCYLPHRNTKRRESEAQVGSRGVRWACGCVDPSASGEQKTGVLPHTRRESSFGTWNASRILGPCRAMAKNSHFLKRNDGLGSPPQCHD
jgi:hypothetical protein